MQPKTFKIMFSKLSRELTVDLIAKERPMPDKYESVADKLPVFDALDLLVEHANLITKNGLVITRKDVLRKPVKVLFYALITEIEYRLYHSVKSFVQSQKSLQEATFNDLIKEFLAHKEIFVKQDVYDKKQQLKEDLKAISSFRNVIMHSNRKLDLESGVSTIVKRKKQALKLMNMLDQVY